MDDNKLHQLGLNVTHITDEFVRGIKMIPRKVKLAPLSFKKVLTFGSWSTEKVYQRTVSELKKEKELAEADLEKSVPLSSYAGRLSKKLEKIDAQITSLEEKWEKVNNSKKATATPKLKKSLDEAQEEYNQMVAGLMTTINSPSIVVPFVNNLENDNVNEAFSVIDKINSVKSDPIVDQEQLAADIEAIRKEKESVVEPNIDNYLNQIPRKVPVRVVPREKAQEVYAELEKRREQAENFKKGIAISATDLERQDSNDKVVTNIHDLENNDFKKSGQTDSLEVISRLLPEYQEIMAPVLAADEELSEEKEVLSKMTEEARATVEENRKMLKMNQQMSAKLDYMRETLRKHAENERQRIEEERMRVQRQKQEVVDRSKAIAENTSNMKSQFASMSREVAELEDVFAQLGLPTSPDVDDITAKRR